MLIKRVSLLTGESHEKELPITQEQLEAWESGSNVQDVMPHLSAADREFVISGCTAEEWEMMKEEPEDSDSSQPPTLGD